MEYIPDNYEQFVNYEAEQERTKRLRKKRQREYEKEEMGVKNE